VKNRSKSKTPSLKNENKKGHHSMPLITTM